MRIIVKKEAIVVSHLSQLMCPLVHKHRLRFEASNHIEVRDLQTCKRVYGSRLYLESLEMTMRGLTTPDSVETLLLDSLPPLNLRELTLRNI
jgi:hypothetical protein